MTTHNLTALLAVTAAIGSALIGSAADAATATVIATGLVNPKGIDQSPSGALYVAEAGNGGSECTTVPGICFGLTGAVTRVDPTGVQPPRRVIAGLPSLYGRSPRESVGPNDVSFSRYGAPTVVMGLGGDAVVRAALGPAAANLGQVLRMDLDAGTVKPVADITAFEQANNPDRAAIDSNPYGIEAQPGEWAVTDAGANTLIRARANGRTSLLATFPPQMVQVPGAPAGTLMPSQAVPTSVTKGPDGYYYVGTLTGFPFAAGTARVWRVAPWGGDPEVCASGFTTIVDDAFDPQGRLYVLEISGGLRTPIGPPTPPLKTPGALKRIASCGAPIETLYDNADPNAGPVLEYPAGVVIGLDGAAYVTNKTVLSGGGEVLRIALDE